MPTRTEPSRLRLVGAYLAVYLVWGSTYLAIRFAIESLPPFLMASLRFVVAGGLLYTWARLRGAPRPARLEWRSALIVGGLLLLCGNGGVVWAEQHVPSGTAALLVATVSLWVVLLEWRFGTRSRPSPLLALGVLVGLGGVALLVLDDGFGYGTREGWLGAAAVVLAAGAWAAGSLYSRAAPLPASPLLATAMQMLGGGLLLGALSLALGEPSRVDPAAVSVRSVLALAYLVVFGSLVAFSAYVWLLRVQPAARVATYAYVNPMVALLLGWGFGGEPLAPRTVAAAGVIVLSVGIITRETGRRRRPRTVPAPVPMGEPGAARVDGGGDADPAGLPGRSAAP